MKIVPTVQKSVNPVIKTSFITTLLLCLLTPSVLAAKYGKFTYQVVADSVTITRYPRSAKGQVVIPSAIEGKPVTYIRRYAFADCEDLTRVTIPDSVTTIGQSVFYDCKGLIRVTISSGVTSIGRSAFSSCFKLEKAIFRGNAPKMGGKVFRDTSSVFKIYYLIGNVGFSSPEWKGYPTVALAELETRAASLRLPATTMAALELLLPEAAPKTFPISRNYPPHG